MDLHNSAPEHPKQQVGTPGATGGEGKRNSNNKNFQFWQQDNHPMELYGYEMLMQELDYLHDNPVRAGLVYETWHYKYSSAVDYCTNMKGLLGLQLV